MADYRLIHRNAASGDRSSSLSHLGFRVWVQYQLSADDYGICRAEASKLIGDNPALGKSAAPIQREIENLIAIRLAGVFVDGRSRYLYQKDWQEWQRIDWPTQTSMPCIPLELFAELSPKTQKLFAEKHPKRFQVLGPHAGARNASATADANADADLEGGLGETAGPPLTPRGRPGLVVSPGAWGIKHAGHTEGLCGWKCMFADQRAEFANGAGWVEDAVTFWAKEVRAEYERTGRTPTGKPYDFWNARWEERHGSSQKPKATSVAQLDATAGIKEFLRNG